MHLRKEKKKGYDSLLCHWKKASATNSVMVVKNSYAGVVNQCLATL